MAIYHFSVRGITPARGSSAVLSAAYQSGQALTCERTGESAAYSRRERVRESGIGLPPGSPEWASDRQRLWNEAEASWRGGTALVARRIEFALPRELDADEQRALVVDYAGRLAAKGLAADWAIHDAGDGNPHAHVLASALRLGPSGFIAEDGPRTTKAYLVRNASGEERTIPAADWKGAKADGWEKVFNYRDGRRLTKSEAKAEGLGNSDRTSTNPVSSNVSLDGGSSYEAEKAALVAERKAFADMANARLAEHAARNAEEPVTIDHRSNAERGIDAAPTIHEGWAVRRAEARAEAEALAEGREYEPVTGKRRENVLRRGLNRAVEALGHAARRAMAWWRRRTDAITERRRASLARQEEENAEAARRRTLLQADIGSAVLARDAWASGQGRPERGPRL